MSPFIHVMSLHLRYVLFSNRGRDGKKEFGRERVKRSSFENKN